MEPTDLLASMTEGNFLYGISRDYILKLYLN